MPLIQAYLIHHNDPDRRPQREAITALLAQLDLAVIPVVEQPPLAPLPKGWLGRWALMRREWAKRSADFQQRRLREPHRTLEWQLRQHWMQLKGALGLWRSPRTALQHPWRHTQVEAIVSGKHGRAWRQAQAAGVDCALVFEDDVSCQPDSLARLTALLQALPSVLQQQPELYLDLAGGYPPGQVLPLDQALPGGTAIADWWLPAVHTNTACAYLASGPLLQRWLRALDQQPALAELPIDHLINSASARQAPQSPSGHWREPPFRHGSFCGLARSWQQ
jgi:hypothetical protein